MKAKLYVDALEAYGNNLVQTQDNNANEINEMVYMLWDITPSMKASILGKQIMRHELMIMVWSLLWLALHDQEDLNDELALIKVEGHRTATGSAAVPHSPVQWVELWLLNMSYA